MSLQAKRKPVPKLTEKRKQALAASQVGNTNAAKGALFRSALSRAMSRDDFKRLNQAAEKLLSKAAAGEPWAINMLADRLDGAAKQTHTHEAGASLMEMLTQVAAARTGRMIQPLPAPNE